jgi:hypothetical protein
MTKAHIHARYLKLSDRHSRVLTVTVNILAVFMLLALLIASCLIRRPRHQPKAIPFQSMVLSLCCHIMSVSSCLKIQIFPTLLNRLELTEHNRTMSMIVTLRFSSILDRDLDRGYGEHIVQLSIYLIFFYLRTLLMTYMLFRLLDAYNARVRNKKRKIIFLSKLHRIILIILAILPLLTIFCFFFQPWTGIISYTFPYYFKLAGGLLFLLTSMEIMVEVYVTLWKQKDIGQLSKVCR